MRRRRRTLMLTAGTLLLCLSATAQSQRLTTLQNARNLVITDAVQGETSYYMVTSEKSQMIYRQNGKLTIGGDDFTPSNISFRLQAMPRFVLDEDNTDFDGKEEMSHGLLALHRSLNVGKWNTIVLPISLTSEQVRDAFGDDVQLAKAVSAGEAETVDGGDGTRTATLDFQTVDLTAADGGLQAGVQYIIKPSREPDVAEGSQTSVAYGSGKVAGPVYVIGDVTMEKGKVAPDYLVLRSPSDEVRLRFFGTYTARTGTLQVKPMSRPIYLLGNEGHFSLLTEPTDVKAFSSWLENASKTSGIALRFAIDGVSEELTEPTGIMALQQAEGDSRHDMYDLQGRRVKNNGQRGLYIVNGKKVIMK